MDGIAALIKPEVVDATEDSLSESISTFSAQSSTDNRYSSQFTANSYIARDSVGLPVAIAFLFRPMRKLHKLMKAL